MRILLFLLILCTSAAAQIAPMADAIGIYADMDALTNTVQADVGESFEVYVLVTRPSGSEGMLACEFKILAPENIEVWGWNLEHPNMCLSEAPDFQIAYSAALPVSEVVHVMTIIAVARTSEAGSFRIGAYEGPSGGNDVPVYIDAASVGTMIPLRPWPAGVDQPSLVVNGALVANETETVSSIKMLYR